MNEEEVKEELVYAIQVWQRGGDYKFELDNGTIIERECMDCFLNGAGWSVEDIPEDRIEEIASAYIDCFRLDLFF